MNRFTFVPFALAFLCLFTYPVSAATWYVDASVTQSADGATWETAFQKIQEGIDAASDSDTVIVAPGIYIENIHFPGKNSVLTSTGPLDLDIVACTVIDGNRAGSVVTFAGTEQETCVLSGFTIQNGIADEGGGIYGGRSAHCKATIRNNVIQANSASYRGGGVAFCDGVIEDNTVSNNSADFDGGGLYNCNGSILGNVIAENDAKRGAGLASCQAMIGDNTISGNRSSSEGGGLYRCHHTIRNNAITRCFSSWGGALAHCDGLISRNLISENRSSYSAGALYECDGTIADNIIAGNSGYRGGGLAECDGAIRSNVIAGNFASKYGGALVHCYGTIQNNTISANLTDRIGGGFYGCNGSIQGNTIHANRARVCGGAFYDCAGAIVSCIIFDNSAGDHTQLFLTTEPTYCCIQNWAGGGQGNMAEDPRFVDPDGPDNDPETYEDNDYRLLPDSPCVDAGFNQPDLPAKDIAGMRRIMYGGKSLTVDMGAYEYYINEVNPGPGSSETTLTWSSIAGSTYAILYTEDLVIWILAEPGVRSAGDQTTSWTDDGTFTGVPPSLSPRRFYCVLGDP